MKHYRHAMPAIFASALALSSAALSAETYSVPEGCTATVTSQTAVCSVTIYWTCPDGAPSGSASFDSDGPQSIYSYNSQSALIDAQYMWDDSREVIVGEPEDPYSLAMLMLNGSDSYNAQINRTDPTGTRPLTLIGTDSQTGETLVVGDHTLLEIESDLDYTETDGSLNYHSEGVYYLLQSHLILLGGAGQAMDPDGRFDYDETPTELLFAGDPNFADTTPLHGCADAETQTAPEVAPAPTPIPTPMPAPKPTGPIKTGPGSNNDK